MYLQGEPGNDMYIYLTGELETFRREVMSDLDAQFQLRLSDPDASTNPESDVDLATSGTDAGRRIADAERYMIERYGQNWSELLRMNFYAPAERLFLYEQLRREGIMNDAVFGAFQERISALSEVLNFAKMLQHAQGNEESTTRVESLMTYLDPEQQAAARRMAAESPQDAQSRLADLHSSIDLLHARFEALRQHTGEGIPEEATGNLPPSLPSHLREAISSALTSSELQIALAQAITELQMRANFRTSEAYIAPGAVRHGARGVAVRGHEAYQSALSNLEMIEHVLRQADGNVETAIREYELYKYIFRFMTAIQLGGLSANSFMVTYYQAAHQIYRESRTMLQGVGRHDLSMLRAMHDQFVREATEVLPQLRNEAQQRPSEWNPTHRSLEATDTIIRDSGPDDLPGHTSTRQTESEFTIGRLMEDRSGITSIQHVPVRRVSTLEGNETRARFENGRLILELGPVAGHEQVAQHLDTLRALQRYEGTLGYIHRLASRIGELLGMGPGFGRRGHEAQLEVEKLLGIRSDLESQRDLIETAMREANDQGTLALIERNYEDIVRQIDAIESQIRRHASDIDSSAQALGHVAMADTTSFITESDPQFRQQPGVGETWRYRDRGGTEGTVSRLTHDTLAIITQLGQTTVRADYQNFLRPSQVGLPSGRHGFEALHAIGPNVGHESPFGIYFGPWRVNQLIQRLGIERFISNVGSNLLPNQQVLLRVEVERVTLPVTQSDGSIIQVDFLRQITYQLYGSEVSPGNKLFELRIGVDRPDDPTSSVSFDPDSMDISPQLGEYTDMEAVSQSFDPQFHSSDPIDE